MEILVIDTETTGLHGSPIDYVVELSICSVDTVKRSVSVLYDAVIRYDVYQWNLDLDEIWIFNNSSLTVNDVLTGVPLWKVIADVRDIVLHKDVTSFNVLFDFSKFLDHYPFNLSKYYSALFNCIMLMATDVCKLSGYYNGYKWPSLDEARRILLPKFDMTSIVGKPHRSLYDTMVSSHILLALIDESGSRKSFD